jgi:hypothetical protein
MAIGLVSLTVGCVQPVNQSNKNFLTPSLTATRETIRMIPTNPTLTSTPTQLVENTPSPTSKPTYTSTFTPTLLPTSTPWPTLSPKEAEKLVLSLFENNGGCELPCWWGIIPGVTTLPETQEKIPILVPPKPYYKGKGIIITGFNIPVPVDKDPLGIGEFGANVYVQDDLIFAVETNTGRIQRGMDTSLAGLLKVFGPPDEVWINMAPEEQDNRPAYYLDLFFSKKGFLLSGSGLGNIHGDFVRFCPYKFRQGNFPPSVVIFSPLQGFTYESLTDTMFSREVSHLTKFRLLRELVDGMDEINFYNIYLNPTTQKCLDIQREKLQ